MRGFHHEPIVAGLHMSLTRKMVGPFACVALNLPLLKYSQHMKR